MASFILAISGPTAAGKTYFTDKLESHLHTLGLSMVRISTDEFYYDLSHLPMEERIEVNFDNPESIDDQEFFKAISELASGKQIEVPVYDFGKHSRTGEFREVNPADLVVVEGIFSLSFQQVNEVYDLSIYIDLANDLRLIRRVRRDMKERDRSLESVFEQYVNQVRPSQRRYVHQDREIADLIVLGNKNHDRVIDLISAGIRTKVNNI